MGRINIKIEIPNRTEKGFHVKRQLEIDGVNVEEFEKVIGDVVIDTLLEMSDNKSEFFFLVGEFVGNLHKEVVERVDNL